MRLVISMQIPQITEKNGESLLFGLNRNENAPARFNENAPAQPIGSSVNKPSEPVFSEDKASGRSDKPAFTPDGDILDFDWNRIRRFVERYAWKTEPPESIKEMEQYRSKSKPALSWDGDKAEFNFKPVVNTNKTYGSKGAAKSAAPEPKGPCKTCESRRYVDRSDDASVSYQTPTKLSPSTAAMAVSSHEREHVVNDRAEAEREGREIISQSISIKYGVCPECNVMIPTGGQARTLSVESQGEEELPAIEPAVSAS